MTTHRSGFLVATCLAVALAVSAAGGARAASAEPSGLEPELASKIAREKLKQSRRGAGGSDASQCGSVDIGNDDPGDRRASRRLNERSRTVIVTGDVINAARCR